MIARLLLLGVVASLSLGAQSSCSSNNGEGTLEVRDGGGVGKNTGQTFQTTLTLKDSSGKITSQFDRGELITFELTLLNRSSSSVRVQFPALGNFQDFRVYERDAEEALWVWVADKVFAMVVVDMTFAPGESRTFTGTWNQVTGGGEAVPAGRYDAWGVSLPVHITNPAVTEAETQSPRVPFTIR